jgi:hypothetical protein
MADFPIDHAAMPRVVAAVAHQSAVPVNRIGGGRWGTCQRTVDARIAEAGGAEAVGWEAAWLPGVYVILQAHVIWQGPAGDPLDITNPPFPTMSVAGTTTFIAGHPSAESIIEFVPLVRDDDLETIILTSRKNAAALIELNSLRPQFQLMQPNFFTLAVTQSRVDELNRILATTYAVDAAAEWRIFNRYCAGK